MRVVAILAAGIGSRLSPITGGRPKCMVQLGKKTLLEHQVEALVEAGVEPGEIVVVSGHMREAVEGVATRLGCRTLFNPEYAATNNVVTVHKAVQWIKPRAEVSAELVIVNSDTFAHPEVFRAIIATRFPNAVVVDDSGDPDAEAMKVEADNELAQRFGKGLIGASVRGEYIGVAKFSGSGLVALMSVLESMVERGETQEWYEEAFNRITADVPIAIVSTSGLPWTEIDTPEDYQRALDLAGELV